MLVGWDTLSAKTYRNKLFPAYQSGRKFDDALVEQLDALREFVAALGFANARAPGYEADDFLAAAVVHGERRGGTVVVASGDRDTFQLASDRTTILFPVRGVGFARIGPAEVRERYGVEPAQVPDFIAIRGDPSDKLPGAPGMGPQGAASLLHRFGTLEKALKAGRLAGARRQASDVSLDRDDGPQGAVAQTGSANADMGQRRGAGAKVGAQPARRPSRRAGAGIMPRATPPPEAWRRGWRSRPAPGCTACPAPRCSKA